MTMKDGFKWIKSWDLKETERYQDYFNEVICRLLPNKLGTTDWLQDYEDNYFKKVIKKGKKK
jgi:hypothetical protein